MALTANVGDIDKLFESCYFFYIYNGAYSLSRRITFYPDL